MMLAALFGMAIGGALAGGTLGWIVSGLGVLGLVTRYLLWYVMHDIDG